MRNTLLIVILVLFINQNQAQKTYYNPVIAYSSKENTVVKKNGRKINLDSLLVCHYNESLEVIKGSVRLFSGDDEEFELTEGKRIIVKNDKKFNEANYNTINKISRFINEPSVYLPNLYNSERNHLFVFPLKSKVHNQANIKLYFIKKSNTKKVLKFYYNKDSLIWETKNHHYDTFPKNIELEPNHSYFWRLYAGSIGIRGKFELLSEEQANNLKISKPKSKSDYLNAYFTYLENDCKFDAIAILSEARKKFPECKIFKNFESKILIKI